jgi:hypothetical protein
MTAPVVIQVSSTAMRDISLQWAEPYAAWHVDRRYMSRHDELYRLLACVATQLRGACLVSVPTHIGFAALALASGAEERGNIVMAYDAEAPGMLPEEGIACVRDVRAIELRRMACGYDALTIAGCAAGADVLLLDVPPHDGVLERAVVAELAASGFRGLLIMDDIHLNPAIEAAWAAISQRKADVTDHAHWSGTGIVVFDPSYIDIAVTPRVPVSGWTAGGKML